jgi:hypothetical protein
MRKVIFLPIVIGLLSLTFLTSCEGNEYVTILPEMDDDAITYEGMKSILDKYGLEMPPTYTTTPGADIRAVVIPFDIWKVTGGETYDEVRVTLTLFEREGNSFSNDPNNIAFITGVPQSVNREASVEDVSKISGNFAVAASELTKKISSISGGVNLERQIKETYPKFYQTTAFNTRPPASVVWTFTPFKDEELPTGTYYAFALVDVRDPTREFQIQAHTSCIYRTPILFGLFKLKWKCDPYNWEYYLVPTTQLAPAITAEPVAVSTAEPVPVSTTMPAPPLPLEEIVLVFGGWQQIREAVLYAVDWASLIRDQNVNLVFTDLEGEQVDVISRERDIGRCHQWLAEAGYPDGFPNLHVMVLPGSEALIRFAEELGTYLADCGIGTSIEIVDSTNAYSILTSLSAAGEAGLLLSLQAQE